MRVHVEKGPPMVGGREVTSVVVDGVRLAYEERGLGPPMVFVHGFGTSSYTWRRVAQGLADSHRTVALDLMGFGQSDKPLDQPYTMERQAGLLRGFLEALDLEQAGLVGHSYGGGVCLMMLRLYRDLEPASLVLVDTVCYPQPVPPQLRLLAVPLLGKLMLDLVPAEKLMRRALLQAYYRPMFIRGDAIAAYAGALRSPGGKQAMIATAAHLMPQDMQGLLRSYKQIKSPTLILWGEHDGLVPLAHGKRLMSEIPGARIKVFNDCGHMPQEEAPGRVADAISDFFSMLPKHRF